MKKISAAIAVALMMAVTAGEAAALAQPSSAGGNVSENATPDISDAVQQADNSTFQSSPAVNNDGIGQKGESGFPVPGSGVLLFTGLMGIAALGRKRGQGLI